MATLICERINCRRLRQRLAACDGSGGCPYRSIRAEYESAIHPPVAPGDQPPPPTTRYDAGSVDDRREKERERFYSVLGIKKPTTKRERYAIVRMCRKRRPGEDTLAP